MNKDIEQAKREFIQKYGYEWTGRGYEGKPLLIANITTDLTALLDKQREVMMEFTEWIGSQELYCDKGEWLCPVEDSVYGEIIRKTTAELFDYWLMNIKK